MNRVWCRRTSALVVAAAAVGATVYAVGSVSSASPGPVSVNGPAIASAPAQRVSIPPMPVPVPSTPVPVPSTSVAPVGCGVGGVGLWSNLVGCGWPGSANTGYPAGTVLRATSGRTVTVDNAVIDGELVTGSLTIAARNVTVRNSLINYQGAGGGGSGGIKVLAGASAVIDRVEIDGNSAVHACVWHEGASVTVNALNCHDMEDGIFAWATTASASTGDNFTITNSYLHRFNAVESNGHFDGFQTEGAANGVIRHNTFDVPVDATGGISIWNGRKDARNILVEDNLVKGGGFTVYAQDYHPSEASPAGGYSVADVRFVNNKFSNVSSSCVGNWGVWFFRSAWTYQGGPTGGWGATGNVRSGNVIIETGVNVDRGNPSGCT